MTDLGRVVVRIIHTFHSLLIIGEAFDRLLYFSRRVFEEIFVLPVISQQIVRQGCERVRAVVTRLGQVVKGPGDVDRGLPVVVRK